MSSTLKLLLLGGALMAAPMAANAAIVVSSTNYGLAAPAGPGVLIDFDSPLPIGFNPITGVNYAIQTGDNGFGAAPADGPSNASDDLTNYLTVYNGSATLLGDTGFMNVSLFWGSIDTYNGLDLLDSAGNVFDTVTAVTIGSGGNGNQLSGNTNRRVDIASTIPIYGLRFRSTSPAFETDNIKFSGAIPEPTTWAMMITGFGLVGGAMRRRRKSMIREALA